jgi:hypothetical protein
MELIRGNLAGRDDAFRDDPAPVRRHVDAVTRPRWSAEGVERLGRVPSFVRGMVKKIYTEYAVDHGIGEITPDVMDRARQDLGLEGM